MLNLGEKPNIRPANWKDIANMLKDMSTSVGFVFFDSINTPCGNGKKH